MLSPGRCCARAGPSVAPKPGSLRAGLAAGTGWRVRRRLNLQEDILIRSRLRQPSAAAWGRAELLPAPLPRALAGRETEMVAAETGAPAPERPRGAGAFEGFAASGQGQSNPSHARRCAPVLLAGGRGGWLEVGVRGRASGVCCRARRLSGPVLGDSWALGRLGRGAGGWGWGWRQRLGSWRLC